MRTPSKIIVGIALAGMAVSGGAAFTGGGVTTTEATQFIGGSVAQSITGANLANVVYDYDATEVGNSFIDGLTLTFDTGTLAGSLVAIDLTGSGGTTGHWVDSTGVVAADHTVAFENTGTPIENVSSLKVTVTAGTP